MPGAATALRLFSSNIIRRAFPDRCVLCGTGQLRGYFCLQCRFDLPRIFSACGRCGQPVRVPPAAGVDCADCQRHPPPFYKARAALLYAFPVDAALKSFKFAHQLHYAPAFAGLLYAELLGEFDDADALVPVPLHPWRQAVRGFNQAVELCRPLGRRSGLPVVKVAKRVRRTRPQAGLSAAARRQNLRDAFSVEGVLRCRRPLIVDDVMTTGETCGHLARVLVAAGASKVGVLTVARAPLTPPD